MRKIYILTESFKFFYRLTEALKKLKISFKVLSFDDKIPNDASLILITKKEFVELTAKKKVTKNANFLYYDTSSGEFSKYIFKVVKEFRITVNRISEVLFSIDPGEKLGFAIFVQSYYLYSRTFYKLSELIDDIRKCIDYLEGKNRNQLKIQIKVGRSSNKIMSQILINLFTVFEGMKKLEILLVNEENTSKFKLHKKIDGISKHEASALIIALREGKKVLKTNYNALLSQIPYSQFTKSDLNRENEDMIFTKERKEIVSEIFVKLIKGDITINEALSYYEFKNLVV